MRKRASRDVRAKWQCSLSVFVAVRQLMVLHSGSWLRQLRQLIAHVLPRRRAEEDYGTSANVAGTYLRVCPFEFLEVVQPLQHFVRSRFAGEVHGLRLFMAPWAKELLSAEGHATNMSRGGLTVSKRRRCSASTLGRAPLPAASQFCNTLPVSLPSCYRISRGLFWSSWRFS